MRALVLLALGGCVAAQVDLGGETGETDDGDQTESVCARWVADRAELGEGSWSGSAASCDPGEVSEEALDNALRLVNLYRWLTDLDPVETDATRDDKAQQCALMMDANGTISHTTDPSWACYTDDAAEAAGMSNLATTAVVASVELYLADPGNEGTLGHRRWILSNGLGPIGLGSTSAFSCMWVLGGSGSDARDWTAFPSDGVFPYEAMNASWSSIDSTGWSIQSDTIDLSAAEVTITADGEDLPVSVASLASGYGSTYAIAVRPDGWTSAPDTTYQVQVDGVAEPFTYEVELVTCE